MSVKKMSKEVSDLMATSVVGVTPKWVDPTEDGWVHIDTIAGENGCTRSHAHTLIKENVKAGVWESKRFRLGGCGQAPTFVRAVKGKK